ncbi:5-formyltetrahydrofolate cyclo-ligase [Sphingomonas sp. GlSt437]|uniref:5-formyltetrahydrofolate cyclo-ligase n=1 Tax=Sphingomonas sp. GlSt437 TaxID=3389970 RepID=UPI003A8B2C79
MAVPPPHPSADPPESHAAAKAAMRREMLARREDFAGRAPPPFVAPAPLLALLRDAKVVAGYVAMAGEADPAPLLTTAHAHGCTLALPHVTTRAEPMRFLRWSPGEALIPGPFGLRQPAADQPELTPDLLLIPLVAFDARGHRLGHGAGYYDRALAALPRAARIGIAWSIQQVPQVPVDPWDVPLHAILTETDWIIPAS